MSLNEHAPVTVPRESALSRREWALAAAAAGLAGLGIYGFTIGDRSPAAIRGSMDDSVRHLSELMDGMADSLARQESIPPVLRQLTENSINEALREIWLYRALLRQYCNEKYWRGPELNFTNRYAVEEWLQPNDMPLLQGKLRPVEESSDAQLRLNMTDARTGFRGGVPKDPAVPLISQAQQVLELDGALKRLLTSLEPAQH